MVQLGEWSITVSVPGQVPDELAAAVAGALSAEIKRWTAEVQERLGRDLDDSIRVVAAQ